MLKEETRRSLKNARAFRYGIHAFTGIVLALLVATLIRFLTLVLNSR